MRQRSNLALAIELRESDNDGLKRPEECKNRIHGVLFDTTIYYMVNGQDERLISATKAEVIFIEFQHL